MTYANFKPTIWSAYIQKELALACILVSGCWKQFEGEAKEGSRVKILGVGRPTIKDYNGGKIDSPEEVATSSIYLDLDQAKYFNFAIKDIDKAQMKQNLMQELMKEAKDALAESRDSFVALQAKKAGKLTASTAIATPEDALKVIDEGLLHMRKQNVPQSTEVYLELPWFMYYKAATFAAVPDVIVYGNEISGNSAWKGRQYDTFTFAGRVLIDGKEEIVAAVVRKTEGENRYYVHKIYDMDGNVFALDGNEKIQANAPAEDAINGEQLHNQPVSNSIIAGNGQSVNDTTLIPQPVQAGQVTTIYNPYQGPTPVQAVKGSQVQPIVDSNSVQMAAAWITKARQDAESGGMDFRKLLTKFYENVFEQTGGVRNIPVQGLQFGRSNYLVTLNKNIVSKVVSDPRVTPEKLAVFNNLGEVILNSQYVGSGQYIAKEGKKPQNTIRYDYFETPAKIGGQDYFVTFDVAVSPGLNNYRTHKVINQIDLTPASGVENGNRTRRSSATSSLSVNSIAGNGQNVNAQTAPIANGNLSVAEQWANITAAARAKSAGAQPLSVADQWAIKTAPVRAGETDPATLPEYTEMVNDAGGNIPEAGQRTAEMAVLLSDKGISRSKDLGRNLDAASGGNAQLRDRLKMEVEQPLYTAKGEYVKEVMHLLRQVKGIIKETGIKPGSKESAAVQWIGEGKRLDKYGESHDYTLQDLQTEFPEKWQQIQSVAAQTRQIYDKLHEDVNISLVKVYPDPLKYATDRMNKKLADADLYEAQAAELGQVIEASKANITATENTRAQKKRQDTMVYAQLGNRILHSEEQIKRAQAKMGNLQLRAQMARDTAKGIRLDIDSGDVFRNKRLQFRDNYFHHFKEQERGIKGLFNLLGGRQEIDPELTTMSENTNPRSRWAGFMQTREYNGDYTADAIGGLARYIQAAEYKIHIDPVIANMRGVINSLVQATKKTRNANGLIRWMTDFTNDLAGKTNPWDRPFMGTEWRKMMAVIKWVNQRVKGNAVLGNLRSSVAQVFNIPTAGLYIKNPADWVTGAKILGQQLKSTSTAKALMEQSAFLQERYLDSEFNAFDTKVLDKVGNGAAWMMQVGDEFATKLIWGAAYAQGVKKGVPDTIAYADDIARRSVAGRGIGEVPITQKAEIVKLVAPFQVEVNNSWQALKEKVGQKDAGAVINFMVVSWVMNAATRELFGFDVSMDLINALYEGIKEAFYGDEDEKDKKSGIERFGAVAGRMGGELLSNIPGGAQIAGFIADEATRKSLFGEGDPTRFGTGNIGANMLINPIAGLFTGKDISNDLLSAGLSIGLPYGGRQVEKTLTGLRELGVLPDVKISASEGVGMERQQAPASYSDSGRLRFPIALTPGNIAAELTMGPFATREGKQYMRDGNPLLSVEQTAVFKAAVAAGADGKEVFDTINVMRNAQKTADKQNAELAEREPEISAGTIRLDALRGAELTEAQKAEIFFGLVGTGGMASKEDAELAMQLTANGDSKETLYNLFDAVKDMKKVGEKVGLVGQIGLTDASRRALYERYSPDETFEKAVAAEQNGVPMDDYFSFYSAKNSYDKKVEGISKKDFDRQYLLNTSLTDFQRQYLWKDAGYAGNINVWAKAEREVAGNKQYAALTPVQQQSVLDKVATYYDDADPEALRARYSDNWHGHYSGNPTDKHGKTTAKAMGISEDVYRQYREGLAAGGDAHDVINRLPLSVEKKKWLFLEDAKSWISEDKVGAAIEQGLSAAQYFTYAAYIGSLDAKDDNGKTVTGQLKQRTYDYIQGLPISAKQKVFLWQNVANNGQGYKDVKGINGGSGQGAAAKQSVNASGPSFKKLTVPAPPKKKLTVPSLPSLKGK